MQILAPYLSSLARSSCKGPCQGGSHTSLLTSFAVSGEGPKAHIRKLAECIRWSYGAGIVLRLGNIARLELNYCIPMGVQRGDRCVWPLSALRLCGASVAVCSGMVTSLRDWVVN